MESRTKKASRNIFYLVLAQATRMILLFVGRIIFVRVLGASYLGVNSLFSNILSILSLADLGLTSAMMYGLYEPLAKNDYKKITAYVHFFKRVYIAISIVVFIAGVAIIPFLDLIVNLPDNIPGLYFYYFLLLLNTSLSYLFVFNTTLLEADQKVYIVNKIDIVAQIALFILQASSLIFFKSFSLYLILGIVCTVIANFTKAHKAQKLYPYLKKNELLEVRDKKQIVRNVKNLFAYKLGGVIQSNTDNILISIFVGTIAVGYFSNYATIIASIVTIITLVFNALKSSLGNFMTESSREKQYRLFENLEVYNFWLVGVASIFLIVLLPDTINLLFGSDYVLGTALVICMVLNFYTSNIRQNLWAFRETSGIFSKTKYITLVTAVINIGLSIALGTTMGLTGIVLATVVSRMLYAWWKEPRILYSEVFKKPSKSYFLHYLGRLFLVLTLSSALLLLLEPIHSLPVFIRLVIKGIITCFVTFVAFFLIYKKNPATIALLRKVGLKK